MSARAVVVIVVIVAMAVCAGMLLMDGAAMSRPPPLPAPAQAPPGVPEQAADTRATPLPAVTPSLFDSSLEELVADDGVRRADGKVEIHVVFEGGVPVDATLVRIVPANMPPGCRAEQEWTDELGVAAIEAPAGDSVVEVDLPPIHGSGVVREPLPSGIARCCVVVKGPAQICGQFWVDGGAPSRPVPWSAVVYDTVRPESATQRRSGVSARDGKFALRGLPKTASVRLSVGVPFLLDSRSGAAAFGNVITLTPGGASAVDVWLFGPPRLSGRLFDGETGAAPCWTAQVRLEARTTADQSFLADGDVAADGSFSIELPRTPLPSASIRIFERGPTLRLRGRMELGDLADGSRDLGVVTVAPASKVRVRVVDDRGEPIAGVRGRPIAVAERVTSGLVWAALADTDADGRTTSGFPVAGEFEFFKRGYESARATLDPASTSEIVVTLSRQSRLRVLVGAVELPGRSTLIVRARVAEGEWFESLIGSQFVDFPALPSTGMATIEVRHPSFVTTLWSTAVELTRGHDVEVSVPSLTFRHFYLTVISPDGRTPTNVRASVRGLRDDLETLRIAGDDEGIRVEPVFDDAVWISVGCDQGRFTDEHFAVPADGARVTVRLRPSSDDPPAKK